MDDADLDVILRTAPDLVRERVIPHEAEVDATDQVPAGLREEAARMGKSGAAALPGAAHRLVLVLDQEPGRLEATARAVRKLVPDARILVLDVPALLFPAAAAEADAEPPDVILVRADPSGWSAASVLAAYRPARLGRPVDGLLVAEGPLEKYSVLITDFPGLRLIPPDAEMAAMIAGLLCAGLRKGQVSAGNREAVTHGPGWPGGAYRTAR
jgi:hypothetical protein